MKNTGQIFFELPYPFLKVHKREIRLDRDLKYLNVLSHCMLFFSIDIDISKGNGCYLK
jgi:hypothetical protein